MIFKKFAHRIVGLASLKFIGQDSRLEIHEKFIFSL